MKKKFEKEVQGPLKGRVLKGAERAKRLAQFKKAALAGRVEIGNPAALGDKGDGCVKAWVNKDYFGVDYSIPGFGFGGFSFRIIEATETPDCCPAGRLSVDSECMSRDFVKAVMCRAIDEAKWDHDEGKH